MSLPNDSVSNLTGSFHASTSKKPKIRKSRRWNTKELKAIFEVLFRNSRRWLHLSEITEKTGLRTDMVDLFIRLLQEKGWLQFRTKMNERVYALRNSAYKLGRSAKDFHEALLHSCQCADE